MRYARQHGRRLRTWAYFFSLIPAALPSSLRIADNEGFDRAKISRMTWLIAGWTEAEGRRAFEWITDQYLLPTRREHVLRRLREHQARGHLVVIASGTFMPSLQVLGQRLGVSELVGTGVEIRAGRFTGRMIPPIIKGTDKLAQIRSLLGDRQAQIDWGQSYAYGDSFSDREFMALVGHPVAVHPEPKMREFAQAEKWEVLQDDAAV
jgi:HAD superfamily hydrolase (TIGR01490 family)